LTARPFAARFDNMRDDALQIVANVCGPDTHRSYSPRLEPRVASLIALRVRAELVRKTIDLDCERGLKTEEIQIIWAVLMLLAEFEAFGLPLERAPEPPLRRRH